MLLRDIHSKLITQYDCKEVCGPSQSQVNTVAGDRNISQDGVSHQEEVTPLSIPQLNCLYETSFVRDETSVSNADVTVIPSQHRVSLQPSSVTGSSTSREYRGVLKYLI
jgi:hypothetical protein